MTTRTRTGRTKAGLLTGLLVGVVAAGASSWRGGILESLELSLYDLRAQAAARGRPASPDVVVVAVDERTVEMAGGSYPLPRSVLAAVVEEAREAGAKAIALDFVLRDTFEGALAEENEQLAQALAGGRVVVGAMLPEADGEAAAPKGGPVGALVGTFADEAAAERAALQAAVSGAWPLAVRVADGIALYFAGFDRESTAREALPDAQDIRAMTDAELAAGDFLARRVKARHALDLHWEPIPGRFELVTPLPRFALAAEALGGVTQQAASNGQVHGLRHVYPGPPDGAYLSLPLAAAWIALGKPKIRPDVGEMALGPTRVPVDEDGRVLVRWKGFPAGKQDLPSTYATTSAASLLQMRLAREGDGVRPAEEDLARLRGAVAIVSPTLAAAKDKQPTPVNPHAAGGEVLANAVDNLLRGEFVRRTTRSQEAALALLLAVLAALLATALSGVAGRGAAIVALSTAGLGAAVAGWWLLGVAALREGLWLPAAVPLGGMVLSTLVTDFRLFAGERADRRFIHDALGRYTSPALVRTLLHDPTLLDKLGGARQTLTVYFSDIRGFTTISEGLDAERLVELLNEYLSSLTAIIEEQGGYVDKYIGDAIMAFWGAPVPRADHAVRACETALKMRAKLAELRPDWQRRFGVELHARAGLNTGPMVAGNIGSRRKTNYTVLGDAVNLASRLEGANKAYGTEILVGEGTREAAGDAIEARTIDLVRVKGKLRGVAIYELLALKGGLDEAGRARLERWEEAVALYRARRFAEAKAAFARCEAETPSDGAARVYQARCDAFLAAPPPADWDGVFEMHDK